MNLPSSIAALPSLDQEIAIPLWVAPGVANHVESAGIGEVINVPAIVGKIWNFGSGVTESTLVFEHTLDTRLGDCTSVAMEGARWWMGCQPHIRILRGVVRSRIEIGALEVPLHECVALYMADIQEHSALQDEKVLLTIAGGEVTAIEASFMWLGGWRPSCALLLVCSLMGVQLQDEIRSFGLGFEKLVRSEAVLSDKQLVNLCNTQKRVRYEENKLSKKLATIQMLVSDQDVIAAVLRGAGTSPARSNKTDLKSVLRPRMSRLKKLLIQADQLRLQTLHRLFLVLTPVQVAHCAIAAFELAFSLHALGVSDQSRVQAGSRPVSFAKPLPPRLPFGFESFGSPPVCCRCRARGDESVQKASVSMWCHQSTCQT